jgi:hypothetical protein
MNQSSTNQSPEIHVFIIWSKGLHKNEAIISDLKNSFNVIDILNITWPKQSFHQNLTRFYGENLPKNSHKEKECGSDPFICIIVEDKNPKYELRRTSKGNKLVNSNIFDKKLFYRQLTNHDHLIHASDNLKESQDQLLILTGQSIKKFASHDTNLIRIEPRNIVNTYQPNNLADVFSVLNDSVDYVILRNYHCLDDDGIHPDIDIVTNDIDRFVRLINAKKSSSKKRLNRYEILIGGRVKYIDIWIPGDNYLCDRWQRAILSNRVFNASAYTPSDEDQFYTLLYHAFFHKKELSPDYYNQLRKFAALNDFIFSKYNWTESFLLEQLIQFMDKHNYKLVEPNDISVHWNFLLAKPIIIKNESIKRRLENLKNSIKRKIRYKIKKILGLSVDKYRDV